MVKIRLAEKSDLYPMIDLWAENRNWDFKQPQFEEDWLGPTVSYVVALANRWEKDIENGRVMVAYDCRELMGFCVSAAYERNGTVPECLFVNEVYHSPRTPDPELASKLIVQLGKMAYEKGHQRISIGISSDRRDDLKQQCIRLGAKYTGMQGLNYSYIEYFEWDDLRYFL